MSTGVVVVTTLKNFETAVSANSIYVNYINYYIFMLNCLKINPFKSYCFCVSESKGVF